VATRSQLSPNARIKNDAANAALQLVDEPVGGVSEMAVLLHALTALRKGQSDVRLPPEWTV